MEYYADDHEGIWAIDENGNQFVFSYKTKKFKPTTRINPYWGGVSEEYAKQRMEEIKNTYDENGKKIAAL